MRGSIAWKHRVLVNHKVFTPLETLMMFLIRQSGKTGSQEAPLIAALSKVSILVLSASR